MERNLANICSLARLFVEAKDRSLQLAGELEVAVDRAFPDDEDCQDLVLALASYRPGGGEYLYDEAAIALRCKRLLDRLCHRSAV